jgi:hypothetical protein
MRHFNRDQSRDQLLISAPCQFFKLGYFKNIEAHRLKFCTKKTEILLQKAISANLGFICLIRVLENLIFFRIV